jgi:prepilin-type N-terminal cleavage/methylation domain-containing protein
MGTFMLKQKINLTQRGVGFTLIEILVVIAIIGILAVIGLSELRGAKESARDSVRMSDLAQLRLALNLYFDDSDAYPASVLRPDISTTTVGSGTIFSQSGNPLYPGYISRILVDPVNSGNLGLFYSYLSATNRRQYVLCFHKEGGSKNWFYMYSSGIYGEGSCPSLP